MEGGNTNEADGYPAKKGRGMGRRDLRRIESREVFIGKKNESKGKIDSHDGNNIFFGKETR